MDYPVFVCYATPTCTFSLLSLSLFFFFVRVYSQVCANCVMATQKVPLRRIRNSRHVCQTRSNWFLPFCWQRILAIIVFSVLSIYRSCVGVR